MENSVFTPQSTPNQPVEPAPSVGQAPKPGNSKKTLWLSVALVLLAVLVGAAVYFWQNGKVSDLQKKQANLESTISDLQNELESKNEEELPADEDDSETDTEEAANNEASPAELATDQVSQVGSDTDAVVGCLASPGVFSKLWVSYGTVPTSLKDTAFITNGLGLGDAGTLGNFGVVIPSKDLQPGKTYYYQCVAEKSGKEVRAGLATFAAKK